MRRLQNGDPTDFITVESFNYFSTVIALGGGFNYPEGVAVDAIRDVLVADTSNGAVKEIQPGAVNFGSVNVGVATPPTQTLTFAFDSGGQIGGVNVLGYGFADTLNRLTTQLLHRDSIRRLRQELRRIHPSIRIHAPVAGP
jgi:hypothetical protein